MRKSIANLICGSALLMMFCGCGKPTAPTAPAGTPVPVASAGQTDSKETLKKTLEGIRRSGQLTSAMAGMKQTIEQLQDLDLSDELLKDLAKLEKARTPEEVKAISKSMMGRL